MLETSSPSAPPLDPRDESAVQRVSIGESMRWYWGVLLGSLLVFAALGAVFGLLRSTTYTATSQVVVQPLAPDVTQLPVAIQAAEDLATNQSRLIDSDGVIVPLARQFGMKTSEIASQLSATPIPGSTVIKISAQSSSGSRAVALANSAARRFARYATGQVQSIPNTTKTLQAYEAASVEFTQAQAVKQRLEEEEPSLPNVASLRAATAALSTAQIRREALGRQYESSIQSQGSAPSVVPFVLTSEATSDRASGFAIFLFAGIVAGLLIGAALATFLANRGGLRPVSA